MNEPTTQETDRSELPLYGLSLQTAFDTMLTHLRKQGEPAMTTSGSCRYRVNGAGGRLACAVGALIPDAFYRNAYDYCMSFEGIMEELGASDDLVEFLRRCQQRMHDNPSRHYNPASPYDYLAAVEKGARNIANDFDLTYTPADVETV